MLRGLNTFGFVVIVAAATAPLRAQGAATRQGLWYGVGVGAGWTQVGCDICRSDRGIAPAVQFRVGGTINQSWLVGAEGTGWTTSDGSVSELLGSLAAVAYWYPRPAGPWELKAGLGLVAYRLSDDANSLTAEAIGPTLGAGYGVILSRSLSLTPYLHVQVASFGGQLDQNGEPSQVDLSLTTIQIGAVLVRH